MTNSVEDMPSQDGRSGPGQRAGFVSRAAAASIDWALATAVLIGIILFASVVRFVTRPTSGLRLIRSPVWLNVPLWVALLVIYLTIAWSGTGRTIGGSVLGLRVLGPRGHALRPVTALVRAAFCVAWPLGILWVLFSRRNASLQDLVVRTVVLYDWRPHVGRERRGRSEGSDVAVTDAPHLRGPGDRWPDQLPAELTPGGPRAHPA